MKKFFKVFFIVCALLSLTLSVEAHSGRTDGAGGHYNRSTGEYHYHHGYSAHQHYDIDGDGKKDCPYTFDYDSLSKAESNDSKEQIEFGIADYSNDFSMPAFGYPEYTQIPEHYESTSESSNVPSAYVSLSILGVVILIMIVAYIFERRR